MNMTKPIRVIHSRAPIRICDNGGWTDTWFARHGKVFSIAVSPFSEVQIDVYPRRAKDVHVDVFAENYDSRFVADLDDWRNQPLIEATLARMGVPNDVSVEVSLFSEAPAGASTGTSASMTVALVAALAQLNGQTLSPSQIAAHAHAVETQMLKRQSGVQDQLAAAFGGVVFIEMSDYPAAKATRLKVHEDTLAEIERRLVLIFLGKSHDSSKTHELVIQELESRGASNPKLDVLRQTAIDSRDAVFRGDLIALGRAMQTATEGQADLNPALVCDDARKIIDIAKSHGALGWKVNGAGGDGGSISLLCGDRSAEKRKMIRQITSAGPYLNLPIQISHIGARVWEIN